MLGITQISSFIPNTKLSNYDFKDKFGIDELFIRKKIGFESLSRKQKDEKQATYVSKPMKNLKISIKKKFNVSFWYLKMEILKSHTAHLSYKKA